MSESCRFFCWAKTRCYKVKWASRGLPRVKWNVLSVRFNGILKPPKTSFSCSGLSIYMDRNSWNLLLFVEKKFGSRLLISPLCHHQLNLGAVECSRCTACMLRVRARSYMSAVLVSVTFHPLHQAVMCVCNGKRKNRTLLRNGLDLFVTQRRFAQQR